MTGSDNRRGGFIGRWLHRWRGVSVPQVVPTSGWLDVEHQGFKMRLCMEHYLDRSVAQGQTWERASLELARQLVRPGMHVLDVGANMGYYTLFLSRWVGSVGRVIAFEPTAEYSRRLSAHLELNGISNVRVEQKGLSDAACWHSIGIGNSSATMHWTVEQAPRLTEEIELVRLDDWWNGYLAAGGVDRLDFVKVDVDGHEPRFLAGADAVLRKHRPILLVEVAQDSLFVAGFSAWGLADQLENLGYVLHSEKTGTPFRTRREFLLEAANFAYGSNVLAVPVPAGKPKEVAS